MLHDAGVMANPSAYRRAFRLWYTALFSCLARRARVVCTVSKFSAAELNRFVGARLDSLHVIYPSGEHIVRAPPDTGVNARLGLLGRRYVLAVGSLVPNKNLRGVLAAFKLLGEPDIRIVAVGGSNNRIFPEFELEGNTLVRTGYVADAELRALYEGAECLVFPSFYEGFGLPPLEAMHCGCPVIVANRAAMPEICGDAALYCDPSDPQDIARSIRRVLTSTSLREDLQEAGYARARMFTWLRATAQLEELIERCAV
jgi:glycosyltransferase involved in cell wall biosynthesis